MDSRGGQVGTRTAPAAGNVTLGAVPQTVGGARLRLPVTVLDLCWLRPLDDESIARAVADGGGRVLIADGATTTDGFGAEVACRLRDQHSGSLARLVRRLSGGDARIPPAPSLQRAVIPAVEMIVRGCGQVFAFG
jgi:pyruvate/2-oxoglutarate/acetoin dehydrogenase E1 component